jgi:hypothetical protein
VVAVKACIRARRFRLRCGFDTIENASTVQVPMAHSAVLPPLRRVSAGEVGRV